MAMMWNWRRVVFAALLVLVTFLTLTPNPETSEPGFALTRWLASTMFGDSQMADKIAHFLAYGSLGACALWAGFRVISKSWGVPIMLALYGILLEGLQGIGGVRTPELADAMANGLGAIAGYGGYALAVSFYEKVTTK